MSYRIQSIYERAYIDIFGVSGKRDDTNHGN